jgi:hypothetical protein
MTQYFKHPLDYSFERVRRAEEHLIEMRGHVEGVFQMQEDASFVDYDPNPPHQIRAHLPAETFAGMRLGIIVGEVVYNLRAALDYLVFQLAERDSGAPQDDTQFPIVCKPNNFRLGVNRWLKGINPAHVAAIEKLQPYNRCEWTRTLREISNPDKHRKLVTITGGMGITPHDSINNPGFASTNGAIRRAMHPVHGEVNVKLHFIHQIQFADGMPVMETLEELNTEVTNTLGHFKSEF